MILLLILALVTPAAAKPAACPDGRFLLPEEVLLLPVEFEGGRQGIALAAGTVEIDGSCGPATAKVKPGKRGTRVIVRWPACGDRTRALLKGSIASPECGTLRGKVKAKKTKAVPFEAVRSACGDDHVDLAGGETCDLPADEPTLDLLEAAGDAIAAGGTDVPLSADGSLRFLRSTTATGGVDEIVRGALVVARWVHDGDTTTMTVDQDGDGTPEIQSDAQRAPVRSVTVGHDFDDDGAVDRTVSLEQVGGDGLQVEITPAGGSPTGFSTTLVQEMRTVVGRAIDSEGCTPEQEARAKFSLTVGTTAGFQCLRALGLGAVAKAIEGKIAKDGVRFHCGATTGCAGVDPLNGFLGGVLPIPIGMDLGAKFFTGEGACSNPAMVLFHEVLHVGMGEAHSPFLDRTTFEGLATDRVYSCTDLCFRPAKATKGECATCLGVDRCDAKCERFADLPSDPPCDARVELTQTTCPSSACSCCVGCPPGLKFVETMEGTGFGPVGSYVRVNLPPMLGGQLTCGSWSPAICPGSGAGVVSCCQRQATEPASTTFVGTLPFPFQDFCFCPAPPSSEVGTLVAQLVAADNNVLDEDSKPIVCP